MGGRAEDGDGSLNLIQVVIARKQRSPAKKLREDAANGPDVEGVRVVRRVEDDFGRSVPSGDDVLGQRGRGLLVAASQTEVADFEVAVLVEQEVAGLEVAVDDVGGVDVEAAAEELVHKVLAVIVRQVLARVDDSVHVGLHEVGDDVDVLVAGLGWRLLHVNEADDVFVVEEFCGRQIELGRDVEEEECSDPKIRIIGRNQSPKKPNPKKFFIKNKAPTSLIHLLSSLISLTILLASMRSSKALGTFLIATFALIEWSMAEQTTP